MTSTFRRRFAHADRKSKIENRKPKIASTRRRPRFESFENRALRNRG